MLAGDEFGRTQQGNNNAYCQDNAISWVDWDKLDTERTFCNFVRRVLKLRSNYGAFRQSRFLHGKHVPGGRRKRYFLASAQWARDDAKATGTQRTGLPWAFGMRRRHSTKTRRRRSSAFLLLMNASDREVAFSLPAMEPRPAVALHAEYDFRRWRAAGAGPCSHDIRGCRPLARIVGSHIR